MVTNDARCTREIKSWIAMTKSGFSKKKAISASRFKEETMKCYIWSIAWYGAETGTVRQADQKYQGSYEMWCWRKMERSVGLIV